MFEGICIKRQNDLPGNPIDLGSLAEALLFYGRVHVVASGDIFKFLLRTCGADELLDLLQSGFLTMSYQENGLGIRTQNTGTPREVHDFVMFEVPSHTSQHDVPEILQELTGKSGKGRRLSHRFLQLLKLTRFTQSDADGGLLEIEDADYVRLAISRLLGYYVPEYRIPEPLVFDIHREGTFFKVQTNINFSTVNGFYNARVSPKHGSLSVPFLLGVVHATRDDILTAADAAVELAVPESHSIIARCKVEDVLRKRLDSDRTIEQFQSFVFNDGRAIREAVNSGHRNLADVLRLLNKASKFKEWINRQPEDASLREQYCKELMALDWIESLPAKTARWAIFTAAGAAIGLLASPVVGVGAGILLNASDAFLVDRLLKGWRPSQFVQGPLQEFVLKGH